MLPPELEPVLRSESAHMAYFVRVGTNPVARFASCPFRFTMPSDDDVDPDEVYYGNGRLLSVPPVQGVTGTEVVRSEFRFAVTDETMAWVRDGTKLIIGAEIDFAIMYFNHDPVTGYSPAGPVLWMTQLTADVATYQSDPETGQESIVVSGQSGGAGDRSPMADYWTQPEHLARYPGDIFLDHVSRLNALTTEKWPADG